jgi:signal peptide peptidase SppA
MSKLNGLWLGSEDSFKAYLEAVERGEALAAKPKSEWPDGAAKQFGVFDDDEDDERPFGRYTSMVEQVGNLAVVTISGTLTNRESWYNSWVGLVSYDRIRGAILAAAEKEDIDGILLDIDSPGGAATGIQEAGNFIKAVDRVKPVYTHTSTMMASGGYWLGSFGREVTATELAQVGSIGVILVHMEYTEYFEKAGIKATVLRKGKYKALLNPYEKLSNEARAEAETSMDFLYDVFTRTVAENRSLAQEFIKQNAAEGKLFFAPEALNVGLLTALSSYDEVVNTLVARHNKRSSNGITFGVEEQGMKKGTLTAAVAAAIASGAQVPEAELTEENWIEASAESEHTEAKVEEVETEVASEQLDSAMGVKLEETKDDGDASSKVVDSLMTKVSSLQDDIADLKIEVKETKRDLAAAKAADSGLRKVAAVACQRMQIALGQTASAKEDSSGEALVDLFNSLNTQFCEQFKIGAQAQVPTQGGVSNEGRTTQLEDSAYAASR